MRYRAAQQRALRKRFFWSLTQTLSHREGLKEEKIIMKIEERNN